MTTNEIKSAEEVAEKVLRELYDWSYINNCTEYLDGLKKYPPDGYGDPSLKEYWEGAKGLVVQALQSRERIAVEAFREVLKMEGPYKQDRLEHAHSVLENIESIVTKALKALGYSEEGR